MKSIIVANLYRGVEAVGGHLSFEENQMIFKSHALNIQTGETVILYSDIANVQKRNTIGFVPNGMLVTMKNGADYKFVIWNRNEVIQFIKEKMGLS